MLIGASALTLAAGGTQAASCGTNTTSVGAGVSCTGALNWTQASGAIVNDGTITGTTGVTVAAGGRTLTSITNNGTISVSNTALQAFSSGVLGNIINNGLLQSTNIAISALSGGAMGTIFNNGTINGGIINRGTARLVIVGITDGSGNYGTLTSPSAIRTIESTVAGILFAAGNSLIDVNMNSSLGQTVTNGGASLKFLSNRTITGNFSQTAGSLVFNAVTPGTTAKLSVTGTAALTGGNIVLLGSTSVGSYTILSAAGGVTSSVSATATGYTVVTSIVGGTNLVLTLALAPAGGGGGGGGAGAGPVWTVRAADAGGRAVPIGPVLDALANDSRFSGLLATLSALPTSGQNTALQQLGSPTLVTKAVTGGASLSMSTGAIDQRQMSLLAGQGGGKAAGSAADGSGVWGQVLGNRAALNSSAAAGGFHSSASGITLGADTHITGDLIGGGAFSWLHNDLTGDGSNNGNNSKLDSYQLAAYGSWRPGGGQVFYSGLLSFGRNAYKQARTIDFLGSTAAASYRGSQAQIKLGAGFDIPLRSGLTITPLASLQAARVENDGYQENGAGAANLTVNKQGFNSVESELGVKLTAYTDTGFGRLIGDWQTGWVHSFTNSAVATTATMGGVNFVTSTERLAKDGAHIVLRGTLQRTDNLSFSLEYDGNLRSDFRSQTATAKMRYDF